MKKFLNNTKKMEDMLLALWPYVKKEDSKGFNKELNRIKKIFYKFLNREYPNTFTNKDDRWEFNEIDNLFHIYVKTYREKLKRIIPAIR